MMRSGFVLKLAVVFLGALAICCGGGSGSSGDGNPALPPPPVPVNAWRMFGSDEWHTGANLAESGVPPLGLDWSVSLSTYALDPVIYEKGRVFITTQMGYSLDAQLLALNARDGSSLWSYGFGPVTTVGRPALDGGRIFVQHGHNIIDEADLRSFDAATGSLRWSKPFWAIADNRWPPTVVGNRVFINSGGLGGLYGFDADSGNQIFYTSALEPSDQWSPTYVNGTLYTFVDGNLRAHNPDNGAIRWTVSVPWDVALGVETAPVTDGAKAYVISSPNLYAIDLSARAVAWSATGFDFTGTPCCADGIVYAVSGGSLRALDAASGKPLWSFAGDNSLKYPPVLANRTLYVSSDKNVYAIDLATHRQVWTDFFGGWLAIGGGRLYVSGPTGVLRAYRLSLGLLPSASSVPPVPSGLTANPVSASRVDLSWVDASNEERGYFIERSVNSSPFELLTHVGANATAYIDVGLDPTTSYAYRLRAVNAYGSSLPSEAATATTLFAVDSWSMLSENPAHTGENADATGAPPLVPAWTASLTTLELNGVAVEDGRVFATSLTIPGGQNSLWALDEATGAVLWEHAFGNVSGVNPPSVSKSRVFVQMGRLIPEPHLFCFNAATGDVLWTSLFGAQEDRYQAPTIVGDNVYINGGYYGGMYGYDVAAGKRLFFNDTLEQNDGWTPSFAAGTLYSFVEGNLRAHDPATGTNLWTVTVPWTSGGIKAVPVITGGKAFVVSSPNLYAIDTAARGIAWSSAGSYSGIAACAGGVVYALNGGNLDALNAATSAVLWSFDAGGVLKYPPVVANGYVYVSGDTKVFAVRISDHTQAWTAPVGGWLSLAGGRLFVAGTDGVLRAYSLTP